MFDLVGWTIVGEQLLSGFHVFNEYMYLAQFTVEAGYSKLPPTQQCFLKLFLGQREYIVNSAYLASTPVEHACMETLQWNMSMRHLRQLATLDTNELWFELWAG